MMARALAAPPDGQSGKNVIVAAAHSSEECHPLVQTEMKRNVKMIRAAGTHAG